MSVSFTGIRVKRRYNEIKDEWLKQNYKAIKEFVIEFHKMTGSFPYIEQVYDKFRKNESTKDFSGCFVAVIYDGSLLLIE